ncbi:MAG: DUF1499 domain-containing protein [Planctomycetaceae bacterium]
MFWLILFPGILLLIVVVLSAFLSWKSRTRPSLGIVNGQLVPCPNSPNCVCSESHTTTPTHAIKPIPFSGSPVDAFERLKRVVTDSGGELYESTPDYFRAEFTSRIFRYVDDVEARLDAEGKVIHVRSSSRVGRSDLGANRQRIEQLRQGFQ